MAVGLSDVVRYDVLEPERVSTLLWAVYTLSAWCWVCWVCSKCGAVVMVVRLLPFFVGWAPF